MVKKIHIVRKSRRRSRRRSPRKSKKNKKSKRRSRRKSNTKKLKGGGGPDWTRKRIEREAAAREAAARGEPGPATEGRLVNVEEWRLKEYLIPHVGGKPKFLRDKSFNITPEKEEIILDLLKKV